MTPSATQYTSPFYTAALESGKGENKVICCVCGKHYHQLSVHLKTHDHTVAEYNAAFPGAPTISDKTSAKVSASQQGKAKGIHVVAPAEPVIASAVHAYAEEKATTPKPKGVHVIEYLSIGVAVVARFGGWSEQDSSLIPTHDKGYQINEKHLTYIAVAVEEIENLLITGPTGGGKTTSVQEYAALTDHPLTRVNLNADTTASDLVGDMVVVIVTPDGTTWSVKDLADHLGIGGPTPITQDDIVKLATILAEQTGGQAITEWQDGPLITAMRKGHICLVDEIDAANPGVHFIMQRVAERHHDPKGAIAKGEAHCKLLLPTGEVVGAHPNFRLIATANTVGSGDLTGDYAATNVMNQAFLDRWGIKMRVEYPEKATWINILRAKTAVSKQQATAIVNSALKVNKAKAMAQCRVAISPRKTLTWARLSVKFSDMALAAELTITNGIDPLDPDAQFIADVITQIK